MSTDEVETTRIEELEKALDMIYSSKSRTSSLKSKLATLSQNRENIKEVEKAIHELDTITRNFDIIDYLVINKSRVSRLDLGEINESLQDVKMCMNDFDDGSEYQKQASDLYSYLQKAGRDIVRMKMITNISELYVNTDFAVFMSMISDNLSAKIEVEYLRARVVQCRTVVPYCIDDRFVFYRMMVYQEMFLYSRVFGTKMSKFMERLVAYDTPKKLCTFEMFICSLVRSFLSEMDDEAARKQLEDLRVGLQNKGEIRYLPEFADNTDAVKDFFVDSLFYICLKDIVTVNDVVEL